MRTRLVELDDAQALMNILNPEIIETSVGFALVSTFRDRPAYATTVENSVYVFRQARGRGVGEVLLRELINTAQESGFHSLIAYTHLRAHETVLDLVCR